MKCKRVPKSLTNLVQIEEGMMLALLHELLMPLNRNNNNNNNNTYIALIRMRSKRFTSIVLQYDLEI